MLSAMLDGNQKLAQTYPGTTLPPVHYTGGLPLTGTNVAFLVTIAVLLIITGVCWVTASRKPS